MAHFCGKTVKYPPAQPLQNKPWIIRYYKLCGNR
jgi:hypothetical protein